MTKNNLPTINNDFGLTPDEFKVYMMLQSKINNNMGLNIHDLAQKLDNFDNEIKKVNNLREMDKNELKEQIKIGFMETNETIKLVQEKTNYTQKGLGDVYVGLGALGDIHIPSIQAGTMGKLLVNLKLAKRMGGMKGVCTPTDESKEGLEPLSKANQFINYNHYQWHIHKTWNKIKATLEENNLLNDFEKCKTVKEIKKFIDNLNRSNINKPKKRKKINIELTEEQIIEKCNNAIKNSDERITYDIQQKLRDYSIPAHAMIQDCYLNIDKINNIVKIKGGDFYIQKLSSDKFLKPLEKCLKDYFNIDMKVEFIKG